MNRILTVIIGQLGFAFDGERIHLRILAPGNKLNTKPYISEKDRRKTWQRGYQAKKRASATP